jgi:hypothetical protein
VVFELPLSVAVRVALWLLAKESAAAVKAAVLAPAGTVTDAGTLSCGLLLDSIVLPAVWKDAVLLA